MTETYNPASKDSRRALASALMEALAKHAFQERPNIPSSQERQIARRLRLPGGQISKDLQVVVYTTIVGERDGWEMREVGKDAIRVAMLYKKSDGGVVGVGSTNRVNRVGLISDIVQRVMARVAEVEAKADKIERCRDCNAPRILSVRSGTMYCADKCWLNEKPHTREQRRT